MAENKTDYMGGNKDRDGDAVKKIAQKYNIDPSRLKKLVEEQKKGGVNNLTYAEIEQIAKEIAR